MDHSPSSVAESPEEKPEIKSETRQMTASGADDAHSDTGNTDRGSRSVSRSKTTSAASSATSKGKKATADEAETGETSRMSSGKISQISVHSSCQLKDASMNPFSMPADNDIFLLRDRERQKKLQERIRQRELRVHEKSTYKTRVNSKSKAILQPSEIELQAAREKSTNEKLREDQMYVLKVTRDRQRDRESLSDYIRKKREMFLVQYSLGVKRDEMVKLEQIAAEQEKKLVQAERFLEEDAAMFDEFLKENDRTSAEAIKMAESENRAKLDKVAEIKRINTQIMGIRGEVSKYEDILKEYLQYKKFLINVAPKEWQDQRAAKIKMHKEWKKNEGNQPPGDKNKDSNDDDSVGLKNLIRDATEDDCLEAGGSLYFSDPQQLLDLFAELEEQNLSLIQNSQETEEALEEMKHTTQTTKQRLNNETDMLNDQIERLTAAIQTEEEKAQELESKAKMFSYGEYRSEDQDRMLSELNEKVEEVYRSCIGDNQANISTLQMLTNIENRLEELFEQIEMMPPDRVEAAEKAKERERRLKSKLQKAEEQRLHQQERIQRALERSRALPNKRYGRPLVMRSEPPQTRKKEVEAAEQATREEEELAYYFLP